MVEDYPGNTAILLTSKFKTILYIQQGDYVTIERKPRFTNWNTQRDENTFMRLEREMLDLINDLMKNCYRGKYLIAGPGIWKEQVYQRFFPSNWDTPHEFKDIAEVTVENANQLWKQANN